MQLRFTKPGLALLAAVLLAVGACGDKAPSTPEATAQQFITAMNADDVDGAVACFVARDQLTARKEFEDAIAKRKKDGKEVQTTMSFKRIDKMSGWTLAVIEVKDKKGGNSIEMKMAMVEVDGEWFISDTKSQQFAQEQAQKR